MTADEFLVAFLERVAQSPEAAANELENLAHELLTLAHQLREQANSQCKSPGGVTDKVKIKVSGPAGERTVEVN